MEIKRNFIPINHTDLTFNGGFWAQIEEKIRKTTMPWTYVQCETSGRIDALRLNWKPGDPKPHIFWDSDVAKWVESAAIILQKHEDQELFKKMEYVVDLIIGAQQPDGYLNSYFTTVEPEKRWTNLRDRHELYCAGHLMEAAVEHYNATNDKRFLDCMCRYADYIDSVFGPEDGKKRGYPGHEEIELALIKLFKATGNEKYLKLSKFFVDERGNDPHYYWIEAKKRGEEIQPMINLNDPKPDILGYGRDLRYFQSHLPIRDQDEAVGHAVRGLYLYSGVIDVALETHDSELVEVCKTLWEDINYKKIYITGGVGQARENEGFMSEYNLPNYSAYAETCAAIAHVFFNERLLELELNSAYADAIEIALYNGILSALSIEGNKFFYENPLGLDPNKRKFSRTDWFACSCCPNNLTRLYASLGKYFISKSEKEDKILIHLFDTLSSKLSLQNKEIEVKMNTLYPWDESVNIDLISKDSIDCELLIRIPSWCLRFEVYLNDKDMTQKLKTNLVNGYMKISQKWVGTNHISIKFHMPIQFIKSHPKVKENLFKTAIMRGPIVYCFESENNENAIDPESLLIRDKTSYKAEKISTSLGDYVGIKGNALYMKTDGDTTNKLYFPDDTTHIFDEIKEIELIPYYLWANRGISYMSVWINSKFSQ